MGKIKMDDVWKYLAFGAAGLMAEGLFAKVPAITSALAKIPMWDTAILDTTVGGIVYAAVGIGIVSQFVFK